MARFILLLGFGTLLSGCASGFTSIERQDDGTYMLTESTNYFNLMVVSKLYQCEEQPDALVCKQRNN